jgi:hypothetical protein
MAPQNDYRVKVRFPNLSYSTVQKLKILEVSALGIHQLAVGVPVTESKDRDLLAKLLAETSPQAGSAMVPRVGWEMKLRSAALEDRRRILDLLELAAKSLPVVRIRKTG